jgi:hypothetical protein
LNSKLNLLEFGRKQKALKKNFVIQKSNLILVDFKTYNIFSFFDERARELPGEDLAPDELKSKLEHIQNRLANIEEVALEKELLLQHVTRLLEKQQERNGYSKVQFRVRNQSKYLLNSGTCSRSFSSNQQCSKSTSKQDSFCDGKSG